MDQHDPRATFQADQEAAHTEQATRDELAFSLNLRQGRAQAAQAEAIAAYWGAKTETWKALSTLLWVLALAAIIAGLGFVALSVVELFR